MDQDILYSIICISRGRPLKLARLITSVFDENSNPASAEMLIRFDDDDELSLNFYKKDDIFKKYKNIRVFSGPRFGYSRTRIIKVNLYAQAKGEFLINIADDCYMCNGYDKTLLPHKGQSAVVGWRARLAITRKAYETYEFIRTDGGIDSIHGDQALMNFARQQNIYKHTHKIFAHPREENDQTKLEGCYGGWKLSDLSILKIPDKEITQNEN